MDSKADLLSFSNVLVVLRGDTLGTIRTSMLEHLTLPPTPWPLIPPAPHLNGLVERLVVFLDELPPDVEQVDLTPWDHDPGEGLLIRASTLVESGARETQGRRKKGTRSGRSSWVSICSCPFPLQPGVGHPASVFHKQPWVQLPCAEDWPDRGNSCLYELNSMLPEFMSTWSFTRWPTLEIASLHMKLVEDILHWGEPKIQWLVSLHEGHVDIHTDKGRDWRDSATSQETRGFQATIGSWGRGMGELFSLRASRRNPSCQHLHFGLLAARIVREYTVVTQFVTAVLGN